MDQGSALMNALQRALYLQERPGARCESEVKVLGSLVHFVPIPPPVGLPWSLSPARSLALPSWELSCHLLPQAPASWTVLPFMLVLGSRMF